MHLSVREYKECWVLTTWYNKHNEWYVRLEIIWGVFDYDDCKYDLTLIPSKLPLKHVGIEL